MKKSIISICALSMLLNGCAGGFFVKDCKDCSPVCEQAGKDANAKIETEGRNLLWFALGFALMPVGIAIAAGLPMDPSPAIFTGKSPEYVAEYTKCYRDTYSVDNANFAITGCYATGITALVASTILFCYFIWMMLQIPG